MTWTLCSVLFCFYAVSRHCLNASINLLLNTFLFLNHGDVGRGLVPPVVPGLCTKLSHGEIQIFRSTLDFLWSEGENHFCSNAFVWSSHPLKMRLRFQLGQIDCCDRKKDHNFRNVCIAGTQSMCIVACFCITANIFCHGFSYPDYLFVLLFSECLWF